MQRKRRFQSVTSASAATLRDVTTGSVDVGGALREVAEHIQRKGYVHLTQAAEILQKRHTGRALEKLIATLPIRAFSHSRKEGWVIVAKDQDEQHDAMTTLIKLVEALQEEVARFGNDFASDQFRDLIDVCEPSERLILRYTLTKIFGAEAAAKRYGMKPETLTKDAARVDAALQHVATQLGGDANSEKEPSKYKRVQAFHKAISNRQHGGRTAWETDDAARDAAMTLIMDAVRAVPLSMC